MNAPLISDLPLWEQHVQRVLDILRAALLRLRANAPQGGELKLNRELYLCILEVNAENQKSGGSYFDHGPVPEGQIPPTPDTEGTPTERKIPDLRWEYIDHQAPDARRGVRNFTIECKRLGSPSNSGWKFNLHYVNDGVSRFVDPDFRYGSGVATGAMVGYVESLTPPQIVAEVNEALELLELPVLALPLGEVRALVELEHSFSRPFKISPFRLVHIWVDIRQ